MIMIEKIKEIVNKMLGKTKKGVAIGALGVATTATLLTGCGDKNKDFKQQYQYDFEKPDPGKDNKQENQQNTLAEKVDNFKSEQEVRDFINAIYIEATGDDKLEIDDITISGPNNQNFVYVNQETDEMITHGKYPDEVVQKLKNNGVSYTIKDDVDVYKVEHKDGKIIDCMTLQNKDGNPVRVIIGEQYDDETYESVLVKLGDIIPAGLQYAKFIETERNNDKETSKAQLKKALEERENAQVLQEECVYESGKNPEEGLEHE